MVILIIIEPWYISIYIIIIWSNNKHVCLGSPDSGALCLEKAAKMIEQQHPDKAVDLYRRGMDVVLTEDRPRQAGWFIGVLY